MHRCAILPRNRSLNWAIFKCICHIAGALFCLLTRLERSTDQVIKPINMEALSKWVGAIPKDVVKDMALIAPMLEYLGMRDVY